VIDVNLSSFQTEVIDRSRRELVVVDFWAPWCGPCRTLGPILERLAGEAAGAWTLVKLNTDDNQPLARKYGIQGIPAVKAFRNGEVVAEFVGALPEGKVREWLETVMPSPATQLAEEAAARLAAGDVQAAAARYAEALALDPGQPDALLFSARDALERHDADGAKAAVARIRPRDRLSLAAELGRLEFAIDAATPPSDGSPAAEQYAEGCARAAAGDWEAALEQFLAMVKEDRAWGDDAGRKAMLRVFDVVGQRSPIADAWRRRLSMELYK
jgi:putative thioredoxin